MPTIIGLIYRTTLPFARVNTFQWRAPREEPGLLAASTQDWLDDHMRLGVDALEGV
jgi:hypothetical protein